MAVLLAGSRMMARNDVDADLWGHVQYGREWLATGELPMTTTWSFVVEQYRWINHENGAELLFAWTADTFGPLGFTLGKFLLSLAVLGLMLWHNRREHVGWIATALFALLAADNLAIHWQFRPQLITYVCFTLMIALLGWCFHGWEGSWCAWPIRQLSLLEGPKYDARRIRRLWLMVPLMVLWTNSHGGFAAGLVIYVTYLLLRSAEAWLVWGRAAWPRIQTLLMMAAAAALATLITPYGPRLPLWMVETLRSPPPEIGDWAPVNLLEPRMAGTQMLVGLAVLSLAFARKPRDLTQLAILAAVGWQAMLHMRHIPVVAILCGFWLPGFLDSLLRPVEADLCDRLGDWRPGPVMRWGRVTLAGVWLGLMCGQLAPALADLPVPRSEYPVAAMEFLARHGLRGNTIVSFNWAQYAIGCFAGDPHASRSRVAIDGRWNTCYPKELLDIYLDLELGLDPQRVRHRSLQSPPIEPARALALRNPDLVLVHRTRWHAHEVLSRHQDQWTLLYQDSVAQVWGRRNKFDDPQSPDYFPPQRRVLDGGEQSGSVTWPALPEWNK